MRAVAVLVGSSSAAIAAPPAVDGQLWNELDATYPLAANWSATAIFATRVGNDLPNPTLTAGGLQIDYRSGPWTATETAYYVSIRNAGSGARTAIWLPAVALAYEAAIGPITLSDRSRLEQFEGLSGAPTRYRNRASAEWHVAGPHSLSDIFVADEAFYDFSRGAWTRNRAQVGVEFRPAAKTRLQTFYLRQNNSYGAPSRLNALGFTLQLDIK